MSGTRTRAEGGALSQVEVLSEAMVPFLSPPPAKPAGRHHR